MEDDSDTNSPLASPDSLSDIASPLDSPDIPSSPSSSPRPSVQHAASDRPIPSTANMTASSTPLGNVNAARNPARPAGGLNPDMLARMRTFHQSRTGPAPRPGAQQSVSANPILSPPVQSPGPSAVAPGFAANLPMRPMVQPVASSPAVPGQKLGLSARRGMALPGGLPGQAPAPAAAPAVGGMKRRGPPGKLSDMNKGADSNGDSKPEPEKPQSQMDKYAEFIDKETGALKFHGKATVDSKGIKFASGKEFSISLDEVDTLDELGKGNYGTVYKVRHSRPKMRRPGQGLAGNKAWGAAGVDGSDAQKDDAPRGGTGVVMAMKEMRLELEDSKFATIIMELDVLHRCASPYIVDFYGAFFQEGAVYICMEFMDGGSIDKIYAGGVPEGVLAKVTLATVQGLKSLKDDHNIIHRDVKPTNILVNTRGQVKICDFGVSGNLVASIAKTNIGCQSYMAPERISGGGIAQAGANPGGGTYSVQSDIWSLGLSIIECALGKYPYSPETYDNIFSQLSVSQSFPVKFLKRTH
jgi:mitogen-activated protein kinase kinase